MAVLFVERLRYLSTQAKDDHVRYIHGEVGYNYRLTNVQAAIGVAQLEMLPDACRRLEPGPPAYPVEPSETLRHKLETLRETLKESS